MLEIRPATEVDGSAVVELQSGLFREDAGAFERYADLDWPRAHGLDDFRTLMADEDGLVLLAVVDGSAAGTLIGYATDSGPTRQPIRYAVLRTLYVTPAHRDGGVGAALVTRFLDWARERHCVEAQVNHYAANVGAGRLYERLGFEAHSLNRVLHLE